MGQYGSARVVYGWLLTEEEQEYFNNDTGVGLWDWTRERGLDYVFGGNSSWDDQEYVVGIGLDPWFSDFGAYEIDDSFGLVPDEAKEKLKPHIEFFGREPKKYLVTSYG